MVGGSRTRFPLPAECGDILQFSDARLMRARIDARSPNNKVLG